MEEFVKSKLQNGEQILWSGTPVDVKLMQKPYTLGVVIRFVLAAVLLVTAVWYFFSASRLNPEGESGVLCAIMLIIAIYLATDPLLLVARLKKKTFYCITNQRAITCHKALPPKLRFRNLNELDEISVELINEGNGNIYFGRKTKRAPKMARAQYAMTELQEADEQMPMVFCNVRQPQAVYECIPVHIGKEN